MDSLQSWKARFEICVPATCRFFFFCLAQGAMCHMILQDFQEILILNLQSFVNCTESFERKHWKVRNFFLMVPLIAKYLSPFLWLFTIVFQPRLPPKIHIWRSLGICNGQIDGFFRLMFCRSPSLDFIDYLPPWNYFLCCLLSVSLHKEEHRSGDDKTQFWDLALPLGSHNVPSRKFSLSVKWKTWTR